MPASLELAVVGGSGFYEMPGLQDTEEVSIETPFGAPSDAIRIGTLEGVRVAFLARHGRGHTILPSELPQRANFWALKSLGVKRVLAVSAVGSLRGEVHPGEMVVPDQLIDRTRGARPQTFFGDGVVAHIGFADPFCPAMRTVVAKAARAAGAHAHEGGTYVVIEGPAFGTRAESELYRSWGLDVVGMTALPEAKLAREAEICYATLAAVTDYDSWNAAQEAVEASSVFEVLQRNVEKGRDAVRELVRSLGSLSDCDCRTALDRGLVTPPRAISEGTLARLGPILSRRLGAEL
ncbi:MAG TPA: S-methyl-5'-thioadenosine phosphorylase [Tepidiformaceae bacterium]|nr:S-methyl-5'-thioadenosine phosphorylase [Tepidiformaceae bacterium]